MTKKDYLVYISDIINTIMDIEDFINDIAYDEFINDKKTIFAVERGIEIIGEATKRIPNSIKNKYPEIPWKDMAGIRDKVSHDYNGIDLVIIWKTIQQNLPELKAMLSDMIAELKTRNGEEIA
ncbi:MAG: hypothetical protein QG641_3 [Candidatus Poribacteria bacterium]|nr:hypothetical protein [Candidatus Poribacteria bacterium]